MPVVNPTVANSIDQRLYVWPKRPLATNSSATYPHVSISSFSFRAPTYHTGLLLDHDLSRLLVADRQSITLSLAAGFSCRSLTLSLSKSPLPHKHYPPHQPLAMHVSPRHDKPIHCTPSLSPLLTLFFLRCTIGGRRKGKNGGTTKGN